METQMRKHIPLAAALIFAGASFANAQTTEAQITEQLTKQGFHSIEFSSKDGPAQGRGPARRQRA
jgi:hypothetical protein